MSESEQRLRDLADVKTLLGYEAGLTEWEVRFVENVSNRLNSFRMTMTEKQRGKIDQILRRLEA